MQKGQQSKETSNAVQGGMADRIKEQDLMKNRIMTLSRVSMAEKQPTD